MLVISLFSPCLVGIKQPIICILERLHARILFLVHSTLWSYHVLRPQALNYNAPIKLLFFLYKNWTRIFWEKLCGTPGCLFSLFIIISLATCCSYCVIVCCMRKQSAMVGNQEWNILHTREEFSFFDGYTIHSLLKTTIRTKYWNSTMAECGKSVNVHPSWYSTVDCLN